MKLDSLIEHIKECVEKLLDPNFISEEEGYWDRDYFKNELNNSMNKIILIKSCLENKEESEKQINTLINELLINKEFVDKLLKA